MHVSHSSPVGAVDQPGEKAAAATVQPKLSDQDKVQWLTDRIAHGMTDLIRTRPDQTSPNAEKGRWVKSKNKPCLQLIWLGGLQIISLERCFWARPAERDRIWMVMQD